MTTRRILLGGLWHETNTFSPIKTDLGAFQRFGLAEGEDIIKRFAGSNTEIGGVVGVAADLGLDLAPSLYAGAVPSGPIRRELLNYFVERICAPLRDDGDIAGAPPGASWRDGSRRRRRCRRLCRARGEGGATAQRAARDCT